MTTTEQVLTKIGLKGTNTTYEVKDEVARNLVAQAQTAANEAKRAAESMQSQITEKEAEITSLEGQLSTTQETLTSTQSQLATVQGQLEVATARVEELEEQIAIKPGRDLSEYTWEEIVALSELAKLNKTEYEYLIGQTKGLDIGEKWPVDMQLVGIAHDDLSNGNGKAGFSFLLSV